MNNTIPPGVKWGALGLFAGVILLVPTTMYAGTGDSALWFIALLVMMTAALTLTAIVFGGLNLSDPSEAFGLPSGSVRTLLAVGVMVLFAVFGLKFFGDAANIANQAELSTSPIEVEVPAAKVAEEVARYEKDNVLRAVVKSPGKAASGSDPGVTAKISLYALERNRTREAIDVQKQLLTAIITLLTTVIGFYFGSKSTSEGMRKAPGSGVPPADPAGLAPQRDALKTDSESIEAEVATLRAALSAIRALPSPEDQERAKLIFEGVAKALDIDGKLDALRQALSEAFAIVQDKVAAVATAAEGTDRATREAESVAAISKAREAYQALKQEVQLLAEAIATLRTLTAEG
jgi:hypothetical protein